MSSRLLFLLIAVGVCSSLLFVKISLARAIMIAPLVTVCDADVNQSGKVDIADYSVLVENFFKQPPPNARADINKDGVVDITDFSFVSQYFFLDCILPTPTPVTSPTPVASPKPPSPTPTPIIPVTPSPRVSPLPSPVPTPTVQPTAPPGGAVLLSPTQDLQSIINSKPAGTTYIFQPGLYRMQKITPKNGDTYIGDSKTILNGSKVLTSFTKIGSVWRVTGQTQKAYDTGEHCRDERPRCYFSNELFINDQRMEHVDALAKVGPGTWFFDYDLDAIYVGDDPTNKKVETSVTDYAFVASGTANNVTIKNFTIEKYANPGQRGAIYAFQTGDKKGIGWVIENNEIRNNHGGGITFADGNKVRFNKVIANGQSGIDGTGKDALVEGNEVAYNNATGYDSGWGAGGSKFFRAENLKVINNYFHHNDGPGFWTDIDNKGILYENNIAVYNNRMGIQHEISFDAVMRNNYLAHNGYTFDTWMWGAQLLIQNSSNVEAYNNTIIYGEGAKGDGITIVQQNRGYSNVYPKGVCDTTRREATCTLWLSLNNHVHDNKIYSLTKAGENGAAGDYEMEKFALGNNRFLGNQYFFVQPDATRKWWSWPGGSKTWDQWNAFGFDTTGSTSTITTSQIPPQPAWNVKVGQQ